MVKNKANTTSIAPQKPRIAVQRRKLTTAERFSKSKFKLTKFWQDWRNRKKREKRMAGNWWPDNQWFGSRVRTRSFCQSGWIGHKLVDDSAYRSSDYPGKHVVSVTITYHEADKMVKFCASLSARLMKIWYSTLVWVGVRQGLWFNGLGGAAIFTVGNHLIFKIMPALLGKFHS